LQLGNLGFEVVSDAGDLLLGDCLMLLDDDGLLRFPLSFLAKLTLFHLSVVVSILALQLINLIEEPLRVQIILILKLSNDCFVPSLNVLDFDVLGTGR
jgi:hypothetical protein